jgi:hypothetical protein
MQPVTYPKLSIRNQLAGRRGGRHGDYVPRIGAYLFLQCTDFQLTSFDDETLSKPLGLIETKIQEVGAYVDKWLQFQSLWDLEAEYVYNVSDALVSEVTFNCN